MVLETIIKQKEQEVRQAQSRESKAKLKQKIYQLPACRDFRAGLSGSGIDLIGEVKQASPSQGVIREDFKPKKIAAKYQQAGAAAVSVLTDQKFFQGSIEYLSQLKQTVNLPLLRKDFILDPYQIYQARAYGADALLLIAAILDPGEASYYLHLARELGLDVLFEVHNQAELETALAAGAEIIGINNRDLTNFEIDLTTTFKLQEKIPSDKVVVSESGIQTDTDVNQLAAVGVDAVLIGSALMEAERILAKINDLFSEKLTEAK